MRGSVLVSNNRPLMVLRLSETISLLGWSLTTRIHERARQRERNSEGKRKGEGLTWRGREQNSPRAGFSKGSEMDGK